MAEKRTVGRPSAYETIIEPRLKEVQKWAEEGATDKDIARALGLNPGSFSRIKSQNSGFRDFLKKAHEIPVKEIKRALYKRAIGYSYEETSTVTEEESGVVTKVKTTKSTKYMAPDPASAMILLKHWDKENEWTNDPATLKLKKKELAMREKQLDKGEW